MARKTQTARQAAVGIVAKLVGAGYTAYLAGGCVRDALLGLEPKDYDVATDAEPAAVRGLFRRSRYVGEAFGVVQVNEGGHQVEVATFRKEWGYADGRRPSEVHFTDAEHDAQRRDFTINGLFAAPAPGSEQDTNRQVEDRPCRRSAVAGRDAKTPSRRPAVAGRQEKDSGEGSGGDRIIDYVGGQKDLAAKLVRAIGEPGERFGEDYLRMLRAVRFAARLGFEIESRTAESIREHADKLGRISRERIGQEVRWMLTGANRSAAARLMQALGLDAPVLDEAHAEPDLPTVEALGAEAGYAAVLVAWMIDRHEPNRTFEKVADFAERRCTTVLRMWRDALNLSNEDRDALRGVLSLLPAAQRWAQLGVAARKRLLAQPWWGDVLCVLRALPIGDELSRIESQSRPLFDEGVAPRPLVNGDDLIALGVEPGPVFGRLLDAAYDAQLEKRLTTREEALAWLKQHAGRADSTTG